MKGFIRKIEAAFAAAAFAEEGEAEAARQMVAEAEDFTRAAPRRDDVRSRPAPRAPLAKGSRA